MLHDITSGVQFDSPVDVVISGHTHYERLALVDGIVYVNSGSPYAATSPVDAAGHGRPDGRGCGAALGKDRSAWRRNGRASQPGRGAEPGGQPP